MPTKPDAILRVTNGTAEEITLSELEKIKRIEQEQAVPTTGAPLQGALSDVTNSIGEVDSQDGTGPPTAGKVTVDYDYNIKALQSNIEAIQVTSPEQRQSKQCALQYLDVIQQLLKFIQNPEIQQPQQPRVIIVLHPQQRRNSCLRLL